MPVAFRASPQLLDELRRRARDEDRTVSAVIRRALAHDLERSGPKDSKRALA